MKVKQKTSGICIIVGLAKSSNTLILRALPTQRVLAEYKHKQHCTSYADVAQLVEQRIRNAKVGGSTPLIGTTTGLSLDQKPI